MSIPFHLGTVRRVYTENKGGKGTELYNKINRARMGIAFHTTYVGETLADMDAQFGADISGLRKTNDVWVDDATIKNISGTVTLTKEEQLEIQLAMKYLNPGSVDATVWSAMQSNSEFINSWSVIVSPLKFSTLKFGAFSFVLIFIFFP